MQESHWLTNFISTYERKRGWVTVLALVFAIAALGLTAERIRRTHQTPGPFNQQAQGFCDFQNGVYLPSVAFLNRVSPYSQEYVATYPVPRSTPFYSPASFLLHAPFALLPMELSEYVYFVWLVFVVTLIAYLTTVWIKPWTGSKFRSDIFSIVLLSLIVSRGGQQTIYTGYFTYELVLATLVALQYSRTRPWVSAIALTVVAIKPNFVLPLGLLMLCRGNFRALFVGGFLSIVLALVCAEWIKPEGGYVDLLAQIHGTQEAHRADPIEKPVNTWVRVDAFAIVAKWMRTEPTELVSIAAMFVLLIPTSLILIRNGTFRHVQQGVMNWSGGLILITCIVSIYHHVFDAAILIPWTVWCTFVAIPTAHRIKPRKVWVLILMAFLLIFPQGNYFSTQKILTQFELPDFWFQVVTSMNSVALFAAWLLVIRERDTLQRIEESTCEIDQSLQRNPMQLAT